MGFLSDILGDSIFDPGGFHSKAKPTPLTPEQKTLEKQAVELNKLQLGNVVNQGDFQSQLFARDAGLQERGDRVQNELFGTVQPPAELTPPAELAAPTLSREDFRRLISGNLRLR